MVLNLCWSPHIIIPCATDAGLIVSGLACHTSVFTERERRMLSPVLSLQQHLDGGAVIVSSHWLCLCFGEISSINYNSLILLSIEKVPSRQSHTTTPLVISVHRICRADKSPLPITSTSLHPWQTLAGRAPQTSSSVSPTSVAVAPCCPAVCPRAQSSYVCIWAVLHGLCGANGWLNWRPRICRIPPFQ